MVGSHDDSNIATQDLTITTTNFLCYFKGIEMINRRKSERLDSSKGYQTSGLHIWSIKIATKQGHCWEKVLPTEDISSRYRPVLY